MPQPQRSSAEPAQPAQPAEQQSQSAQPSQGSDENSSFVHIPTGTSSQIRSINYNPKTLDLICEFMNGSVYHYFNVDQIAIGGISRADSPGRYFNQNIVKGDFEYEQIS